MTRSRPQWRAGGACAAEAPPASRSPAGPAWSARGRAPPRGSCCHCRHPRSPGPIGIGQCDAAKLSRKSIFGFCNIEAAEPGAIVHDCPPAVEVRETRLNCAQARFVDFGQQEPGSRAWDVCACTGSSTPPCPPTPRQIAAGTILPSPCQNKDPRAAVMMSELNGSPAFPLTNATPATSPSPAQGFEAGATG